MIRKKPSTRLRPEKCTWKKKMQEMKMLQKYRKLMERKKKRKEKRRRRKVKR